MKQNSRVVFIGLFGIAVAFLIVYYFGIKKRSPTISVPIQQNSNSVVQSLSTLGSNEIHRTDARPPLGRPIQTKSDEAAQGLATLNDPTIEFYGKVEDQDHNPVQGAAIEANIQINNGNRVGVDRFKLTTDELGKFAILGQHGKAVSIIVTKPGYVLATTQTRFIFSDLWPQSQKYTSDPNQPAVIKMWKLKGREPLVFLNRQYKVPYLSIPYYLDLVNSSLSTNEQGDLKISVLRSSGIVSQQTRREWGITIEAVQGGIIPTSRGSINVTYESPIEGYIPETSINFAASNWTDLAQPCFFVRSRNGQVHAAVSFALLINRKPDDQIAIKINGFASTNSSRNFER